MSSINNNTVKVTIYSDAYKRENDATVSLKNQLKAAKSLRNSAGNQTERLHIDFFGQREDTYDLAIKTLTSDEQRQIKANNKRLGWWSSLRWVPLEIDDKTLILVNKNSAVKRLMEMGLKESEIRSALESGTLLSLIRKDQVNQFKKVLKDEEFSSHIFDQVQKGEIDHSEAQALLQFAESNSEYRSNEIMGIYALSKKYQLTLEEVNTKIKSLAKEIKDVPKIIEICKASSEFPTRVTINNIAKVESSLKCTVSEAIAYYQYADDNHLKLSTLKAIVDCQRDLGCSVSEATAYYQYAKDNQLKLSILKAIVNCQRAFNLKTLQEAHPKLNELIAVGQTEEKIVETTNYMLAFGIRSYPVARRAIIRMARRGIDANQIARMTALVNKNLRAWREEAARNQQPVYIKASEHAGNLPRNLQCNPDGSIYVLFNRVKTVQDLLLGQGGYKKVKTAMDLATAEIVARSTMKIHNLVDEIQAKDEFAIGSKVSGHEGIGETKAGSGMIYTSKSRVKKFSALHKLHNGGELFDVINASLNGERKLTEQEVWLITMKLLSGLDYLHNEKIIHRDLKLENVMLSEDEHGEITDASIIDFGFASRIEDKSKLSHTAGTSTYLSPEYCKAMKSFSGDAISNATTPAIDIWAMGLILFWIHRESVPEWRSLMPPWMKSDLDTDKKVVDSIASLKANWLPEPADKQSIGHLIWEMFHIDPTKRPDARTVKARAFRAMPKGVNL